MPRLPGKIPMSDTSKALIAVVGLLFCAVETVCFLAEPQSSFWVVWGVGALWFAIWTVVMILRIAAKRRKSESLQAGARAIQWIASWVFWTVAVGLVIAGCIGAAIASKPGVDAILLWAAPTF